MKYDIVVVKCSRCGKLNHLYLTPHVDLDCWNCHERLYISKLFHIPTAQEIEAAGKKLGPMHEAMMDRRSQQ